jgi:Flp pilus assembly pilin Flp
MKNLIARFVRDEQGQDLIEYALLGSFVSLAAFAGAQALAGGYNSWYTAVGTEVTEASQNLPNLGAAGS